MIYCILAKLSASTLAASLYFAKLSNHPLLTSFFIGVLPIWMEVLTSFLTKVEPSREKNITLKIIDNVVDGMVFILIPAIWYSISQELSIATFIFVIAGILRLVKFVRNGLSGNFFIGLPVTYTGYVWPLLILMNQIPYHNIILVILAWAMNSKHIKIKATNYEIT